MGAISDAWLIGWVLHGWLVGWLVDSSVVNGFHWETQAGEPLGVVPMGYPRAYPRSISQLDYSAFRSWTIQQSPLGLR